jgi:S1-C subfamily serine protease
VTLAERLQDYAPGAKVELTVIRAGKEIKVGLTLK